MKAITHKSLRSTIGSVFLIIFVLLMPKMQSIINIIETHRWVGVTLIICAMAYTAWGMFWE
jgi:hypothetical protein